MLRLLYDQGFTFAPSKHGGRCLEEVEISWFKKDDWLLDRVVAHVAALLTIFGAIKKLALLEKLSKLVEASLQGTPLKKVDIGVSDYSINNCLECELGDEDNKVPVEPIGEWD